MVKVYFETNSSADLMAIFDCEETYMVCVPALEAYAKANRGFITESITDQPLTGDLFYE